MMKLLLFSVTILLIYKNSDASIDLTFEIYEMCKETGDTPMKYWANFTKINSSISLADVKAIMPYDLDEEVTLNIEIDMLKNDEWTQVVNISRKDPCPLINKYGGEVLFDIEKQLNIEVGTCPLPKGTYDIKNFVIDFTKLPISTIPKASLRSRATIIRKNELLMCFYTEFESL